MDEQRIPLSEPNLSGNEEKYVTDAIKQGWVSTSGAYIDRFESELAAYVKTKHAVACQSGTAGLHLALLALKVAAGQEVIVPSLTFIAAVNPVRYVGAEPVFMDCDDTLCMDMYKLERFCREECRLLNGKLVNITSGKHVSTVIVVHVFGNLADMERLMDIAGEFNLNVVEDATEALGSRFFAGRYSGRYAGTIGHVGVYSFNGNKIITTGGGGMVVANDEMAEHIRYLSTQAKTDPVYFVHGDVGYNYRMTNVQAAIGIGQLERLEKFIDHKKEMYEFYRSCGIALLPFREDTRPNYWFYCHLSQNRDGLIEYLEKNGIQSRPIWHLINKLPMYLSNQSYLIEKAEYYWQHVVNIPCSTNLTYTQAERVAEHIVDHQKEV